MESESKVIRREDYCSGKATNSVKSTASVSVDGRGLNMTPWKWSIFVLFILSWINVSEEGCFDYFIHAKKPKQSLLPVGYVNLPNINDSISCTLQRNSAKHSDFKAYLRDCYTPEGENTPNNTMCYEYTIHNISYHHFMCLMASALKRQYIDCYPGDLCLGPSLATAPTTTMPERTSTAPPPPPTTTEPERTSTAPPTTPTVYTVNRSSADLVNPEKIHGIDKQTVSLLSISVAVNVVLLLLVIFLWMHRRRKELVLEFLNGPTSPQSGLTTEEPNSIILLQNHESSYLIHENENEHEKDPVCNSTDTHSPLNGSDCAVNKMLP